MYISEDSRLKLPLLGVTSYSYSIKFEVTSSGVG